MKRALLVLTLVPVLLVLAAPAGAASLPKPADNLIKVPNTIAGVKIGMAEAKAKAAWGAGRGKCESSELTGNAICIYGEEHSLGGFARLDFESGKVRHVSVFAGERNGKRLTTAAGALLKIKTKGGIGIGSKFADLKKACPKGEIQGRTSESS